MPAKKGVKRKIRHLGTEEDSAVDRLSLERRQYVMARVAGATKEAAAAEIGLNRNTARRIESEPEIRAAYAELVRQAIPSDRMVELIKGGTEATIPVYDRQGNPKKARPDWRTRLPYIQMAAEHGGYVDPKSKGGQQNAIQIVVEHVGANAAKSKHSDQTTAETITVKQSVQ